MPLASGTRLGPYEILTPLGAGGMGEVYRARDRKLGRDVALKILPQAFTSDPDRLARFHREAHVLASLNHPHIGQIYGFEDTASTHALAMEFVDGEDLTQRIGRGPLPLDEALAIAGQIVEALEAAHEQGIIHRDLKPANIKVRPDGTVKVLDFGLAKSAEPVAAASGSASLSPTLTTPAMTQAGMILGTAAYMPPEQARGKAVDKRGDIWAFGVVLFEMLAGRRPFEGDDVSVTLASVLKSEPSWDALPLNTPPAIRRLLSRCLKKDPKERLRDVGDARIEIDDVRGAAPETAVAAVTAPGAKRAILPWLFAAAAGIAAASMFVVWAPWRPKVASTPMRLNVDLGADISLLLAGNGQAGPAAVPSPDGRLLVFAAQATAGGPSQLFIRSLNGFKATALAGTEDAASPFFSPDSQWIAFFADRKLKKVAVSGGAVVTLCDSPNSRGGSWADDGSIVFQPSGASAAALVRVASAGGTPTPVTALAGGELTHRWPQVLPGSRGLIYTASTTIGNYGSNSTIVFQPLPAGPKKVLVQGAYFGRYVRSGHLLYVHEGNLMAAPFNLDRLEVTGPAVPALEDLAIGVTNGSAQYAVSDTGTLVFATKETAINGLAPIALLDRHGRTTPIHAAALDWSNPQFSPDGQRLALDITDTKETDIWVYDWSRDAMSRLTLDTGEHWMPMWTPDGRRLTFRWAPLRGGANVYWLRADGVGTVQPLTTGSSSMYPFAWHPSGRTFAYGVPSNAGGDIILLSMEGDETAGWKPGKATTFLSGATKLAMSFSPDGRWITYSSNESGTFQVYVQSFPGPGGKWLVSVDGGTYPVWSHVRNELLFAGPDNRIKTAAYKTSGDSFIPEKPQSWSDARFLPRRRGFGGVAGRPFDLHPDGERVVIAPYPQDGHLEKQNKVMFVLNFFDELKQSTAPAR